MALFNDPPSLASLFGPTVAGVEDTPQDASGGESDMLAQLIQQIGQQEAIQSPVPAEATFATKAGAMLSAIAGDQNALGRLQQSRQFRTDAMSRNAMLQAQHQRGQQNQLQQLLLQQQRDERDAAVQQRAEMRDLRAQQRLEQRDRSMQELQERSLRNDLSRFDRQRIAEVSDLADEFPTAGITMDMTMQQAKDAARPMKIAKFHREREQAIAVADAAKLATESKEALKSMSGALAQRATELTSGDGFVSAYEEMMRIGLDESAAGLQDKARDLDNAAMFALEFPSASATSELRRTKDKFESQLNAERRKLDKATALLTDAATKDLSQLYELRFIAKELQRLRGDLGAIGGPVAGRFGGVALNKEYVDLIGRMDALTAFTDGGKNLTETELNLTSPKIPRLTDFDSKVDANLKAWVSFTDRTLRAASNKTGIAPDALESRFGFNEIESIPLPAGP
jgi:hypothetical protein